LSFLAQLGLRASTPLSQFGRVMKTRKKGVGMALVAMLILGGISGCGTTKKARLAAWRVAQYDVGGIERLAVLGFRAPPEVAASVESTALEHLNQSGFYQVIQNSNASRFEAAHVPLPTEADGIGQIVARGRQLGADAVLVGRVRKRLDEGTELGNLTVRIGEPELGVMIEYFVVDVHTRSIRAKQRIVRTQSDEAFAEDRRFTARAVDNMVEQCAEEMVSQITAGSDMIEVELATLTMGKGSGYLQDGNKLAGEGEWQRAAEEYLSATQVNPDCHQAIYNLGLAAEAQGRFRDAEHMYNKAIETSDEPLYRDALTRVASAGRNYHLAQRQIAERPRWRRQRALARKPGPDHRWPEHRVGAQAGYRQNRPHLQHPPQNTVPHSPRIRPAVPNHTAVRGGYGPNVNQRPQRQEGTRNIQPPHTPHQRHNSGYPQYQYPYAQETSNQPQMPRAGTRSEQGAPAGQFRP